MIQITKWININERIWYRQKLIPAFEWLSKEKVRLEKLTQKECKIRTDDGKIALFRERLK